MKGFVYVLEMNNGQYYIGSTRNIENRLHEHQNGEDRTTKKHLPVKLLCVKEYTTIKEAIHIEIKLKKGKSRSYTEKFMNQGL
ncbi:MAG: GIY-YIG nuclease family protein [candidate division SR1 bacterium]|nr:GIY-YIG nuclease family protein [candidate division SR1 bacterium]